MEDDGFEKMGAAEIRGDAGFRDEAREGRPGECRWGSLLYIPYRQCIVPGLCNPTSHTENCTKERQGRTPVSHGKFFMELVLPSGGYGAGAVADQENIVSYQNHVRRDRQRQRAGCHLQSDVCMWTRAQSYVLR